MSEVIHVLEYAHETESDWAEDIEFSIGFFASREECERTIQNVVGKRIFEYDANKFIIHEHKLDEVGWTTGFLESEFGGGGDR